MGSSVKILIGGTLTLLGVGVALILGTWLLRPPAPAGPPTALELGAEPALQLGPHDGRQLSGLDTGRVAVGDVAPDFSLTSYAGPVTTLSDYRGEKNVILVFYRGYW